MHAADSIKNIQGGIMKKSTSFKKQLKKYLDIKGLDIIVYLRTGGSIELNKNRKLIKDEIIVKDKQDREQRIHISSIKSIDFYAA
jgi:hypothetical protein